MSQKHPRGFTLIEILVVVMIVGIITVLAIPQYFRTVEKSKTAEAIYLFQILKAAEDRYAAKYGGYCNAPSCPGFDAVLPVPRYFNTLAMQTGGTGDNRSWKVTVTRVNPPSYYNPYSMTYDVEPGAAPVLTCTNPNCTTDLLPTP